MLDGRASGPVGRFVMLALLMAALAFVAGAATPDRFAVAQESGELAGDLPAGGGVALVTWGGSNVDALRGAAVERGCAPASAWLTAEGRLIGYIFSAPSFVNDGFLERAPGGEIASSTGLLLSCRSVPATLLVPDIADHLPSSSAIAAYQQAVDLRDAGQHAQAAEQFGQVAASGGPLAPMAMLRAAQMLERAGQEPDAAETFQAALSGGGLPAPLEMVARLDGARVLRDLDRDGEALTVLSSVTASRGASAGQVADALWLSARIRHDAGNSAWQDDARRLVADFPSTSAARNALDSLEDAGVGIPPLEAGLVRYRHRQNSTARSHFQGVATGGSAPDAHVAWFYLGALDERAGDGGAALESYARSLEFAPNGRLAADAHWWRAAILRADDRLAEAAPHLETLATNFPQSNFAADAAIRAATMRVELGSNGAAISGLQGLLGRSSGSTAARAARWLRVLGSDAPSPGQFDPRSLYAVLDHAGLAAEEPLPASAMQEWVTGAEPDWAEAAVWMVSTYGSQPSQLAIDSDPVLAMGFGLVAAGEPAVGRTVIRNRVNAHAGSPYDLLAIARLAEQGDLHDMALVASERLLGSLTSSQRLGAPLAIEQLSYGAPFAEEAFVAAQEHGVPPLLLLALVRRESAFHPEAVSSAGARGLAQIMPATGQDIARALGVPWDPAMLDDPTTSLQFGAYYLGSRLRGFDGDIFGALAAYNGGAGNASRWFRNQREPGVEWYIETVDFAETRRYLHVVVEDYAWYRYLYAGVPAPQMR